ncbi:MAG: radical SAM protein, partial [Deltaproteobacteria bacterium]|nr:radical SAM protein [Deltaproteobacteria bacterium]
NLWVLIETNGYGLTPENLDYLRDSGVDGFWLDIKAYDVDRHRWLTGCTVERILQLPEEIVKRDFVLEVLSLYIPGVVETGDLVEIARILQAVDRAIPFTILAFFPEYRMKDFRSPSVEEMVDAYEAVRGAGLILVRLGNVGVFASTEKEREYLAARVDDSAY